MLVMMEEKYTDMLERIMKTKNTICSIYIQELIQTKISPIQYANITKDVAFLEMFSWQREQTTWEQHRC